MPGAGGPREDGGEVEPVRGGGGRSTPPLGGEAGAGAGRAVPDAWGPGEDGGKVEPEAGEEDGKRRAGKREGACDGKKGLPTPLPLNPST